MKYLLIPAFLMFWMCLALSGVSMLVFKKQTTVQGVSTVTCTYFTGRGIKETTTTAAGAKACPFSAKIPK